MNRVSLFLAGVSMSRAYILARRKDKGSKDEIRKAIQYIRQCKLNERVQFIERNGGVNMTDASIAAVIQAIRGEVPYPDLHAFSGGECIGNSTMGVMGTLVEDVNEVIKNLKGAQEHLSLVAGGKAAQVHSDINGVVAPIMSIMDVRDPKPGELPNHKRFVDALITKLQTHLR